MASPATSYVESVGSCGPPTPHTPTEPSAPRAGPVRRQLDFTGGGDKENDDDDEEEFFSCVEDFERGYGEAKRRAPPCVCGRGLCLVKYDNQRDQWKYVCPSQPKCKYVAYCEEAYLNPVSEPTIRVHAKPSNPYVFDGFDDPTNHMPGLETAVNVAPQVTGNATPVSLAPSTRTRCIPHGATGTPALVSPRGEPICLCRAGICRKVNIGKEECYVCHLEKGKGACSYKVPVRDFAQLANWQTVAVNTPSRLPVRQNGTPSPIPPPNYICYRCREKGHWIKDCPAKQTDRCFKCGMAGHWARDCPQRV